MRRLPRPSASRAGRAPARPRSACTGSPSCSTSTGSGWPGRRAGGGAVPAYLAFIRDVLPGLGEVRVAQRSIESLVGQVAVTGEDSPEAAAVKADERLATVVRRAAFLSVRPPAVPLELR